MDRDSELSPLENLNNPKTSEKLSPAFLRQHRRNRSKSSSAQQSTKKPSSEHLLPIEIAKMKKDNAPVFFNIMIAGDVSTGKSSFISTFLKVNFNQNVQGLPGSQFQFFTAQKKTTNLTLSLIDTPGYSSYPDVQIYCDTVFQFLLRQLQTYKESKDSVYFEKEDTRVHLCLFFIHGRLKEKDLICMNFLHRFANILPVVSKADGYTLAELVQFKNKILQKTSKYRIKIFDVAPFVQDFRASPLSPIPPFAIIANVSFIEDEDTNYYGRQYLWGNCNLQDSSHTDFSVLTHLILGDIVYPCRKNTKLFDKMIKKESRKRLRALKRERKEAKKKAERIQWWVTSISKTLIGLLS